MTKMKQEAFQLIKEVQRLKVEPDEVLMVTVDPEETTQTDGEVLMSTLQEMLPKSKVILVPYKVKLTVVKDKVLEVV